MKERIGRKEPRKGFGLTTADSVLLGLAAAAAARARFGSVGGTRTAAGAHRNDDRGAA